MCRTGRDDLRAMTIERFKINTDPEDGRRYICQVVDKADKNHKESDTLSSNEGRIYEIRGKNSL